MYILDLDHTSSFFCSSFLPSNECNDLQYAFSLYSEIVSKASYKVSADLCCRRHCLTCALTRRDVARLAQQVASLGGGWQHLGSIQQEVKAGKPWKKKLISNDIYHHPCTRLLTCSLTYPMVRLVDLRAEKNWQNCHRAEHIEIDIQKYELQTSTNHASAPCLRYMMTYSMKSR